MSRKNIIYIMIAVVILAGAVFTLTRRGPGEFDHKQVEVTGTAQEKSSLQKQIEDLKIQIEAAKKSNQPQEKLFQLYVDLGSAQRTLGLLSDARDSYKAAIDLQPNSVPAWTTIYSAYFDLGDFDSAKDAAQKSLALNSGDWNMWRNLIDLETNQFHLSNDDLKKLYEQALGASSANINIVTYYAVFLEKIGDLAGAKAQWQKAIQINPTGRKDYQAEIARLDKLIKQK